jgi:predicted house-cleaning noncanonical NTP pyrophosphatase (MazG superfamily)
LELKKAIQELTNDSLQITELLKNVVVNLGSVDKNNRAIFEEITQLEINAMNYLVSYSSYKEILSQQIGIEYESQLDNKTLENKADVLETTNQMKELLKNIKDNINSANKLLEKI